MNNKIVYFRLEDMASRFWPRVLIGNKDDCWEWQGTIAKGYGTFRYKGKYYQAQRLAYIFHNDAFEVKPYEIVQTCKNRSCCNPHHLSLRTSKNESVDYEKLKDKYLRLISIGSEDECWEWMGRIDQYGFGWISHQSKVYRPHRLAYMFQNNVFDIGHDERILQNCKNKKCCNPKHLHLQVGIRGENNMNAKLIRKQVLEIRFLFFMQGYKKTKLAKMYNISIPEVFYILRRRRWDWLK